MGEQKIEELLKGKDGVQYFQDGCVERCIVREKNELETPYAILVPFYKEEEGRRPLKKSVTFYRNGNLRSVVCQKSIPITTRMGVYPAEMVNFYQNGALWHIFPTFGTLSGFWSEADEYKLSPVLSFDLGFTSFSAKVIDIEFYPNGKFKSFTFWPQDQIPIQTPIGIMKTRIGMALHRNGSLLSAEPCEPWPIKTAIGDFTVYDPDALGMDGSKNSLMFYQDGRLCSFKTVDQSVRVRATDGKMAIYSPSYTRSDYFDDKKAVHPLYIIFEDAKVVRINDDGYSYDISRCKFWIEPFDSSGAVNTCDECFKSE